MPNSATLSGRSTIYSVDAGATVLQLKDIEQASFFEAGNMILLAGMDIQGFGYPPNPHWFEWCRVASVDGDLITVTAPIKNSYKDDWPRYFEGNQFELGCFGPATICRTIPGWDCEHKIYGLRRNADAQTYYFLRKAELFDVVSDNHGWIIGACDDNKIVKQQHTAALMEVDKLASQALIGEYDPSNRAIKVQSSSVDYLEIRGGTRSIDGTGRRTLIHGGSSSSVTVQPIAYGIGEEITIRDRVITGAINGQPGIAYALGANLSYEGDGIFRYVGSSPSQWFIPGAVGVIGTNSPFFQHSPFLITDVWSDGGEQYDDVLFQTTLTGESLPVVDGQTNVSLLRHTPNLTVINCTGGPAAEELSLVPPNSPYGMFKKRTLNGVNTSDGSMGFLMGRLVHLKINVTQAYTGAQSTLTLRIGGAFGTWVVNADMTQSRPTASVNLKIAGERIITPEGVTGAQTGDSNLSAYAGGVWMPNNFGFNVDMSANVSAEAEGVRPIVTVEILTDQEIPSS